MAVITEGDDPAELGRLPEALERLAKGLEKLLDHLVEPDAFLWERSIERRLPA